MDTALPDGSASGSWAQIRPLGAAQGPLGPPKGPFGAFLTPFDPFKDPQGPKSGPLRTVYMYFTPWKCLCVLWTNSELF